MVGLAGRQEADQTDNIRLSFSRACHLTGAKTPSLPDQNTHKKSVFSLIRKTLVTHELSSFWMTSRIRRYAVLQTWKRAAACEDHLRSKALADNTLPRTFPND